MNKYQYKRLIVIDYDSFSRCHLTDIFFRYSRGSKRVKQGTKKQKTLVFVFKNTKLAQSFHIT